MRQANCLVCNQPHGSDADYWRCEHENLWDLVDQLKHLGRYGIVHDHAIWQMWIDE